MVDSARTTREQTIEPGEWVLVRDDRIFNEFRTEGKLLPRWFGPYVVDEINRDTRTYVLRELDGTSLKTRYLGTQIRLFHRRTGEMRTELTQLEAELSEEDELGRDEEETDLCSRMHD
ncbi:MAG: hypothetical protein BJ554DRAFT_5707 [Olpidium bornovanus]|uniref:Uncharacterized protein n=1 Tax=Olpidium bornovanus TaxID=278681 RepID=A0A8H7ZZ68_9FUNG|nr:MAG: hypothetical protein BJ554DRAFT_5707 [Olpidium bornovanus]